ncbi:hypothetical protein Lal_00045126 [Lupinus albus]|nr:hypothetical protein Lal_00045126 [Lupinus albus]
MGWLAHHSRAFSLLSAGFQRWMKRGSSMRAERRRVAHAQYEPCRRSRLMWAGPRRVNPALRLVPVSCTLQGRCASIKTSPHPEGFSGLLPGHSCAAGCFDHLSVCRPAGRSRTADFGRCCRHVGRDAAFVPDDWRFIKPLRMLAASVRRFNVDGVPFQLASDRSDEVGVVVRSVTCMVSDVNLLMMRLKHQALTDPLTGLGNRRWLNERINDRYGHDVGDHVLVAAGELITKHIRPYDLAARIGGEEFCVVLPRTRGTDALTIAEACGLLRGRHCTSLGPRPCYRKLRSLYGRAGGRPGADADLCRQRALSRQGIRS